MSTPRRPPGGNSARQGQRPGQHRQRGLLPARTPPTSDVQAAHLPRAQGRAQKLHLQQLPQPHHGCPPATRHAARVVLGQLEHLVAELARFAETNADRLRIYRLPAYAPELNPAEGIWSLMRRAMANFAVTDLTALVRIVKRNLKKIQYRPHLIDGRLAQTGLIIEETTVTT
ncbi:transposase [Nonomuraea sp. NPDC049421]|uniref:transposase n=1 Tax=Nonomuraea sp. NPDC049421 TaxID=3155275 RepID=UPI00344A325F